jgi:hypothetical protein
MALKTYSKKDIKKKISYLKQKNARIKEEQLKLNTPKERLTHEEVRKTIAPAMIKGKIETCYNCHGTGVTSKFLFFKKERCSVCGGSGSRRGPNTYPPRAPMISAREAEISAKCRIGHHKKMIRDRNLLECKRKLNKKNIKTLKTLLKAFAENTDCMLLDLDEILDHKLREPNTICQTCKEQTNCSGCLFSNNSWHSNTTGGNTLI